jgi:hypothetical protein
MSTLQQTALGFAYPSAPENQHTQSGAASGSSSSSQPQSRQAAEDARKDRTLAEFLLMLDEYEPLVFLFSRCAKYQLSVRGLDPKRGHGLLPAAGRV